LRRRQLKHFTRLRIAFIILLLALFSSLTSRSVPAAPAPTYTNPLTITIPGGGRVENCPDPTIIRGQQPGDNYWYMFCTSDALSDTDKNSAGNFNYHLIPIHKSLDLVNWTYVGDTFNARPSWVANNGGLWAPDIEFFGGAYHLYYAASATNLPGGGSAIGVATSQSPVGPWSDSGQPVVGPEAAPCCPGSERAVIDPAITTDDNGQRYIYYGSYSGGISVRTLSSDGFTSDPSSETQITIPNRYEGADIFKQDGYYYLFVSATNCCNGPLTGYSVFAGRSKSPLGPFVDQDGVSLLAGRVGGTPVISMNGNRWVGPGHNAVFTDFQGQDWFLYHAVDRNDPFFAGTTNYTKRPVLMDALDWIDDWPKVRAGSWASDQPETAPAAQPGEATTRQIEWPLIDWPGSLVPSLSDEFNEASLSAQWQWVRMPAVGTYGLTGQTFSFNTQAADLFEDTNNASVLTEPAPLGDYIVETKVNLNLPPEGCCNNYVQAGLVIYGDDDNYIKLAHVSIYETRQTEFAKETSQEPPGYPRYGNTVIGPPGDWTYLRIAKKTINNEEQYTGYTSRDGARWVRGGTWTHQLGSNARIGLVAMGGADFVAQYDYVRVYQLTSISNPIDDPAFFVSQHYLDFLNREPDPPGLNFWVGNISGCGSDPSCIDTQRNNTSAAYFLSTEFQQTGYLVHRIYRAAYGAPPSFTQFLPDTQAISAGVVVAANDGGGWMEKLEANKEAYVNAFVERAAFTALYNGLGNEAYVDALIKNTGVAFTSTDRDALVTGLDAGTDTRATVLRKVAENAAFTQSEFNPAFVEMQYFGYLRRDPDTAGFQFWLNKLNQFHGDYNAAQMVRSFIVSTEYRSRFGKP